MSHLPVRVSGRILTGLWVAASAFGPAPLAGILGGLRALRR